MTDSIFGSLSDHMKEKEAGADRAYQEKILKKVYTAILSDDNFVADKREAGDEFDMVWFNDMSYIPIRLFAKKHVSITPSHLIRYDGFTKTSMWAEYHALKDLFDKAVQVALFFPVERVGQYVIHDALDLPLMPGFNTVNHTSRRTDANLRIEPMKAFLAALGGRWHE